MKDRNDGAPQDDDLKVGPRPLVERLTAVFAGVAAPKFSRLRVEGSLLLSIGLLALSRVALGLVFEHYDYFAWAELSSVLRFVLLISLVAAFFVCRMSRVQGWQPLIFGLTVLMTVSSTVTAVRIDSDLPLSIDLMMLELITALCFPWSALWQGGVGLSSLFAFTICAMTGVAKPDDLMRWTILAGETILTVYFVSFKFYYYRQTDLVKRLQRSERDHQLVAAMVEWSGDAILSTDLDGTITSWNRQAEKMFGFMRGEAVGQPFTIIVPPENRPLAMSMIGQIKANQARVFSYEGLASTKDSHVVEISMTLYGLYVNEGELVGFSSIMRDNTEHKRAASEHALLAGIVNASEDAIISTSIESNILTWNLGAEKLFGLSAREALGRSMLTFVPPGEHGRIGAAIAEIARTGKPVSFRLHSLRSDGAAFDSWINLFPTYDARGKLNAIGGIGRDISELVKAQGEQALLAAIVESSDDATISISPAGQVMSWNKGAERLFGFAAAEALDKSTLELFAPPEDREKVNGLIKEDFDLIRAGPGFVRRLEVPCLRKDRSPVDVALVVSGIHDASSNLAGLSLIMRDITERKRAEREITKLAAIVNASSDAILGVSREVKIESWNLGAEKAYGYTAQEAIGRGIDLIVPPEELARSIATARQVAESGQPASWEHLGHRRDGTTFVSAVSIFPIRDADGNITSLGGIGRDITQLKRVEQELREREGDLVAAREAALAASRAKSEFLSSMSHEIRTPMNAILGMADLLQESALNPEQKKYLEIMSSNGAALLDLINGILDLARIESGRLLLEEANFDLEGVVDGVIETMGVRAQQKGLELLEHIKPDVPTHLVGDRLRLGQIMINLVGNAIKFTERGQVLLTVERDGKSAVPGDLHFSVADTGIGIASDKVSQLFSDFMQVDSSTTRKYGGSGLGLAIVRRLLSLMGGRVWVESELGHGSVFHFTVHFQVQADSAPEHEALLLSGVRVLVVDDSHTNRLILRETLSNRGAEVDEAGDGPAALEQIRRARVDGVPYHLVILDCRMPGMDGFQVAEQLKADPASGPTVMMLSSDDLKVEIARLHELGLDAYLVKPVRRSELFEVIRTAMDNRPAASNGVISKSEPALPLASNDHVNTDTAAALPLNILLADDSPDNRLLVQAYLKNTGYRLENAENGAIAVAKVKAGNYDLILMDVQMPVMDGLEAAHAIREWERELNRPRVPIFALTASAVEEDVKRSLSAGMDRHISKPIKKTVLLEAIKRIKKYSAALLDLPHDATA